MSVLATFKAMVDNAKSNIEPYKDDHIKVCNYLGIDTTKGYARDWVLNKLKSNIEQLIVPADGEVVLDSVLFADLNEALVYESVIMDVDNSHYLTILRALSSYKGIKSLEQEKAWSDALIFIKDYEAFSPGIHTIRHEQLRKHFPQKFDYAKAAMELRNLGCEVILNDLTLEINNGLEDVAADIERGIQDLSGIFVMRGIFEYLTANGYYFPCFKRHLIVNQISMFPYQSKPMIPFGYLLNLCVKCLKAPTHPIKEAKIAQRKMDDIIKKATLLGTIADARYYGTFDLMFESPANISGFVRRLGLFDSSFSFPSYDIGIIVDFMRHLFKWVDQQRFLQKFGFTIEEVIHVADIINKESPDNGPKFIYLSKLVKLMPSMGEEKILAIVNRFCHEPGKINVGYAYLTHYDKLDFGFRPLIGMSQTKFLLCDKSWCAQGFYESLASMVRELDTFEDECNTKIGPALEGHIHARLSERGITFSHGKYADGTKPDGEVDVLVESIKDISLLEIKKKVLTRASKTGSDIYLIIDLAASLLDAHLQTGRTELLLRKQGRIDIVDQGSAKRIELKEREVERIALTHWDYGSFQDRGIINNILRGLVYREVRLLREDDPGQVEAFKKIQKKSTKWRIQAAELSAIDKGFDNFPFFNCWFLSIPQLLMVLEHCRNNEEFYEVLHSTRHITSSSNNFYYEFYCGYIKRQTT